MNQRQDGDNARHNDTDCGSDTKVKIIEPLFVEVISQDCGATEGATPCEHEDFPEHADRISELKQSDAHFAKLADEYHEKNRAVHRAETDVEPTDDLHLAQMRKERMVLKDQIAALLRA